MTPGLLEQRIGCPYCGESMDVVLDLSAGGQSYVEDCQVCCQPMQLTFTTTSDELDTLDVARAD